MLRLNLCLLLCLSAEGLRFMNQKVNFKSNSVPVGEQIIIMTEVNSQYIDSQLLHNWVHYAKPYLNSSMKLVFDTPKDEDQARLQKLSLPFTPSFIDENWGTVNFGKAKSAQEEEAEDTSVDMLESCSDFDEYIPGEKKWSYGSLNYKRLMNRRPKSISLFLKQGYKVLHIDLDTVWARNPFKKIEEAGVHDLALTHDMRKSYCGCFVFLRPTDAGKEFAERWSVLTYQDTEAAGNAKSFNDIIKEMKAESKLDYHVLSSEDFPNGKDGKHIRGATIYHANFLVGVTPKVAYFKNLRLWNPEPLQEKSERQ